MHCVRICSGSFPAGALLHGKLFSGPLIFCAPSRLLPSWIMPHFGMPGSNQALASVINSASLPLALTESESQTGRPGTPGKRDNARAGIFFRDESASRNLSASADEGETTDRSSDNRRSSPTTYIAFRSMRCRHVPFESLSIGSSWG
jgi:hypothetical protein